MAWLYKNGNRYWVGWRQDGRQILRSTGTADKKKAQEYLERTKALESARRLNALTEDFFRAATGRQISTVPLAGFLQDWLAQAEANTTPNTMRKYRQLVREFGAYADVFSPGMRLDEVTTAHVQQFLAAKSTKKGAANGRPLALITIKGFKRILSSIFIRAANLGYIRGNPVALVHSDRKRDSLQKEKRPFTLAEARDLHARGNPFWQYMIHAAFCTGQSLGDLVTLRRDNVDLAQNVLRVTRRKTGKRVIVPLAASLRELLKNLWPKTGTDFFWPAEAQRYLTVGASSFSQEFYGLMTAAGMVAPRENKQATKKGRAARREMTGLGFHNLRHTFITNLKVSGAVDSIAKELAGHSSSAINTQYTHLPIETLVAAVKRLPEFTK